MLTNEQLTLLIQQGGADNLIPVLWERVRRLIYKIADKYYTLSEPDFLAHGITFADFKQECYPAFLRAIKSYTPDSGYRFSSFLRYPIMLVRERLLYKRRVPNPLDMCTSLNILTGDDSDSAELIEFIGDDEPTPEQTAEMLSIQEIVNNSIGKLSDNEQFVIRAHYFDEISIAAIGKRLRISRQQANSIKQKALKKLRSDKAIVQIYDSSSV
ncbi:MAG: sigma-70 family RNA polymerase sigma factor [Ruminococcus sp.]|nr:sigma-70 family RNA polymerase sigma factor [Ruminococcus sp.]